MFRATHLFKSVLLPFPKGCFLGVCLFLFALNGFAQETVELQNLQMALRRASNHTQRLPILNEISLYWLKKTPDSARYYATQAYKIREKASNPKDKIRAIVNMGKVMQSTQMPEEEVRPYFEKALEAVKRINSNDFLAEIQLDYGDYCLLLGKVAEAQKYFETALQTYIKQNYTRGVGNAYHKIAGIYQQKADYPKALLYYKKVDSIWTKLQREDKAGLLSDIGNLYYSQGDFVEALKYYHQGLEKAQKTHDIFSQGFCLNNIGLAHNNLGNHDEALTNHLEALRLREAAQTEQGISNSYANIGFTYLQMGYAKKGREFIQKALSIERKRNNYTAIAMNLDRLANAFLMENEPEKALVHYKEALAMRKKTNHLLGIATSYDKIAELHIKRKRYQEAIPLLILADSIFTQLNAQDLIAGVNINFGEAYFQLKDWEKGIYHAEKALTSAKKRKTKIEIIDASAILAKIYAQKGEYAQAYNFQTEASVYKDSLALEEKDKRTVRMQALFEFEEQKKNLAQKDRENRLLKDDNIHQKTALQYYYYFVIASILFILAGIVFGYFLWRSAEKNAHKNKQLATQNDEIKRQAEEIMAQHQAIEMQNNELQRIHKGLSEANQEMRDSIAYAHRIQTAVLPTHTELLNALPEYFILYKPRDIVSGDFYWFSEKEYQWVMAVMDCTGHGIPGAFMSLIGNDLLHEIVNLREIINPAQILTELKIRINTVLKQHTTKGRDGMDIGVCVIDRDEQAPDRKLQFAAAHLSLIYFQDRNLQELDGSKIYIGGYDPDDTERTFETKTLLLDKPTIFYMYSDGYQDQFAESGKRKFTKKRLKSILQEVHLLPPSLQHEILDETIEEWKGEQQQTDDIIIFGLKI